MTDFKLHTMDTAPQASKVLLQKSLDTFNMIPNLHAVMAEAPSLLQAYQITHDLFMKSSFDNDELTVVWQTINMENQCSYCIPAHTMIAYNMGVSADIIKALESNTPLPTAKLEALRVFTLSIVRNRGHLDQNTIQEFLNSGYTKQNILEVVLGYSQKIMSNYTNHLAKTPLDSAFQKYV